MHYRVLFVHNRYQQRGGEDSVVDAEIALLRNYAHEVDFYERHNDGIEGVSRLGLLCQTMWSKITTAELTKRLEVLQPDVIHVHNTFPLISPSLYWAASRAKVPVVQTLHNFRLLCPQAMLLREERVCEDCLGHVPWLGIMRGCYRESKLQSAVLTGMLSLHRGLGTYQNKVTRYIALNDFCRAKFIEGGLPAERISVKPNFVNMLAPDFNGRRGGMLFVGRLSSEKGISTLANAAGRLSDVSFSVIGTGPDEGLFSHLSNVHLLGFHDQEAVCAAMCRATCLIMPSIWYENFPRTLVEAFACGLPVIASRLGAMAELIEDGRTGLLFEPGNEIDLAEKIAWAESHPDTMRRMGDAARAEYEAKYTPEINYHQLMEIYTEAIAEVKAHEH